MQRSYRILLYLVILSLGIKTTFAQSDMTDLSRITHLTEQVRDIVLETPGGHPNRDGDFDLTTAESDLLWAMAQEDRDLMEINQAIEQSAQSPCPQTLNSNIASTNTTTNEQENNFKILMTVRYSDHTQLDSARGYFGLSKYSAWASHEMSINGSTFLGGILSLNLLKNKYINTHPNVNFNNLSLVEQNKALKEYVKNETGSNIPDNMILKELTVAHLIKNPNTWKQSLSSIRNNLSFNDKMEIVTQLGGDFSNEYNYDRADGTGDRANGIVTIEQLLESVQHGTPGGVCRDVASAQALMLKEMGVDKAYIVAYKTAAGRHANLLAQDPNNPNNIVKVNYGYATQTDGVAGSSVLAQDTRMPDFGLEYKIYSADGKPITSIPSDLGRMLKESTGGNTSTQVDRQHYSLNKIRVETPYGTGNLFTGTTSMGDRVVGFAVDKRWESANDIINLEVGVAAFNLEGQRSLVEMSQRGFYGRIRSELNSPYLRVGDRFQIRAESSADLALAITNNSVVGSNFSTNGDNQVTEQVNMSIGTRAIYRPNNDTNIEGEVRVNLFPAFNNEVSADRITLAPSEVITSVQVQHNFNEDMTFLGDAGLVLRGFQNQPGIGDSYFLRTGFINQSSGTSATVGLTGPIQSDQARFLDGSTTRISAGVNQTYKRMQFNVSYERDLDLDQDMLMLGIGVNF